jgi:predicted site-specific integrase-resolvase
VIRCTHGNGPRRCPIDINAAEAARRLGWSRIQVTRWARDGRLPGCWQDTYSGAWHVPEKSVRIVVNEQRKRKAEA